MNTSNTNVSQMNKSGAARRWLVPAFACGSVALSLAYVAGRSYQPDLETLERKVARLEQTGERATSAVREVRTVVHERTVEKPKTEVSDSQQRPSPVAAPPESDEEEQYRAEVFAEAQRRTLSDAFASESTDAAWAQEASQLLRTTYEAEGLAPALLQSECRSTMCRMAFRFEHPESSLELFEHLKHQSPWPGHRQFTFDLKTGEGTAYLSRESYELPSVDVASLEL